MKKILLFVFCLCLLCPMAFAEQPAELNRADAGTEEVQSTGEFQTLEIPDQPAILFWIPSSMFPVDTSFMEGPFTPAALYTTEDQSCSVILFVSEISGLDDYAKLMETEGGGSNFRNIRINGVDCISYEVEGDNLECLIYPVTDHLIVSFNCAPMDGDDEWDAAKDVILASIHPAE